MAKIGDRVRRRIIVVDLDLGWRFASLVRTLALDLLGRARDEGIAFRTLYGNVAAGTAPDGRDAVWGAFWPRLYLEDRTSLIAELEEALDSVDSSAGRMLDICVVLPAPTRAAPGSSGSAFEVAVSIWAEFVAILAQRELVTNVGRFALIRPGDNTPDGPEATASMAGLLLPSERGAGDAPFDRVVMLGQRRGPVSQNRQFLLLRAFLDLLDAARDHQEPPAAASRAEDYIAARGGVDLLDFQSPATTPCSLSERLAAFVTRKNGIADETRGTPTAKSDAANFTKQVDELLQKLALWTGRRTHAAAGAERHDNDPGELDSMKVTFWSSAAQRSVEERIVALQEQLAQWWKDQMAELYGVDEDGVHDPKQRRMEFIKGINEGQFGELRKDIDRLNLSPAGLSGVTQAQINQEIQKIEQARASLLGSIAANRNVFAYSGAHASYDVDSDSILNSFSAYAAFEDAAKKTRDALRDLTQFRYIVGAGIYIGFALLTVAMYSLGDARSHALPVWDWWMEWERPAVPALWLFSTVCFLIAPVIWLVLARRQRFDAARVQLGVCTTALTENIHRWTDSVRQYTSDVLHVRFYDEFIDAIKLQRDWNARERFSAVIADLGLGPRERAARLGEEQATKLFTLTKDTAKRIPLNGWFQGIIPDLCEKIEPRPGSAIVVQARRSARAANEATYQANGMAFTEEVRLVSIDLTPTPGADNIEAPPT